MSKKSDYAAMADDCRRMAGEADGGAKLALLDKEAGWRRLALACYDTAFGVGEVKQSRSRLSVL